MVAILSIVLFLATYNFRFPQPLHRILTTKYPKPLIILAFHTIGSAISIPKTPGATIPQGIPYGQYPLPPSPPPLLLSPPWGQSSRSIYPLWRERLDGQLFNNGRGVEREEEGRKEGMIEDF